MTDEQKGRPQVAAREIDANMPVNKIIQALTLIVAAAGESETVNVQGPDGEDEGQIEMRSITITEKSSLGMEFMGPVLVHKDPFTEAIVFSVPVRPVIEEEKVDA